MARKPAGVKHGKHDKGGESSASGSINDGIRQKLSQKKKKHDQMSMKMNSAIFLAATAGLVIMVSVGAYFWYDSWLQNLVRTPLDAPKLITTEMTSSAMDPERFWGTYRSGMYFGLKTRSPHSPVFGKIRSWTNKYYC